MYDAESEREQIERAMEMAKIRKCAACYVAEYHMERHREGGGETKGHFVVFEPTD